MSSLLKLDINRSFVKRTIMTIPYNVTYNGALNQIEDFFKKVARTTRRKTIIELIEKLDKPTIDLKKDLKKEFYEGQSKKYGF